MPKIKHIVLMLLFALPLLLASCTSRPSESQVMQEIERYLNDEYPGMCKIISFEKTNGEGGSKYYRIYFRYRVEILKDTRGFSEKNPSSHVSGRDKVKWISTKVSPPRSSPGNPFGFLTDIRNGDVFEAEGYREYRKTEKGWVASR